MSWVPELKIGLWNAWLLMLYFPLQPFLLMVIDKWVGTGGVMEKMGDATLEKGEKRASVLFMVVEILLIVYSVFLPLKSDTPWFFIGLAVYLLGLVMLITAMVNAAMTPAGQPFTRGIYRFSRHPLYFSDFLLLTGVGLASASYIFQLMNIFLFSLLAYQAGIEERRCLECYGDAYQEYMNRTPRWIGIPKSR